MFSSDPSGWALIFPPAVFSLGVNILTTQDPYVTV